MKNLISLSTRQNIKQYLSNYQAKLETDLEKIKKASVEVASKAASNTSQSNSGYTKTVDSWGWVFIIFFLLRFSIPYN